MAFQGFLQLYSNPSTEGFGLRNKTIGKIWHGLSTMTSSEGLWWKSSGKFADGATSALNSTPQAQTQNSKPWGIEVQEFTALGKDAVGV